MNVVFSFQLTNSDKGLYFKILKRMETKMADGRRHTRNQCRNFNNAEKGDSQKPRQARQVQCPYNIPPGFGFSKCTKRFRNGKNGSVPRISRRTRQSSARTSMYSHEHCQSDQISEDLHRPKVELSVSHVVEFKDHCNDTNCTNDLETDTVVTSDVCIRYLDQSPDGTDEMPPEMEPDGTCSVFPFLSPRRNHRKKGTPVDTPIRITHEYEDTDQGDEFGVTLRTYESVVNGEKVRQHFLVHVESKGPADKMAIRNGDELALLNDIFVPEKTHDELIDIFHHVKVDGNTRLTLVIRRISKETLGSRRKSSEAKRTWEWMETSAILAPDYKHILNERPIVEDCYHEVFHSPDYNQGFVRCRYRTSGRNLYIDISKQGQLIANRERSYEGDQTKILLKHSRCGNDAAGNLTFDAALSDLDQKYYINIRNDTVSLESKPDWFKVCDRDKRIGAEGIEVVFMKNDVFLACDEEDGKITTNPNIYRFTEIQYHDYDTIDSGTWAREANNPLNTRKRNMSLCLHTREPPCPLVNDLDSAGNSSLESTPSDTDVDVCGPDTDFYTQPKSSKTPTTPMEGLSIC